MDVEKPITCSLGPSAAGLLDLGGGDIPGVLHAVRRRKFVCPFSPFLSGYWEYRKR